MQKSKHKKLILLSLGLYTLVALFTSKHMQVHLEQKFFVL